MADTMGGMPESGVASSGLVSRMIRAARLDSSLYEEVEADTDATSQAAIVVVIVALASGIGGAVAALMLGAGGNPVFALIRGILTALLGWVLWAYLTYFIGTRIFGGTATPGEMLRTIGFAQTPGVLAILLIIPVLGLIVVPVVLIWSVVAGVIAVRQALDFDTGKAVVTAVIAFIPYLLVMGILGAIFG